jgi:hypothetical protein
MELTDWANIGAVLGAVFVGMVAMLVLVVHLEQWLARASTPTLAALPVRKRDRLDDFRDLDE